MTESCVSEQNNLLNWCYVTNLLFDQCIHRIYFYEKKVDIVMVAKHTCPYPSNTLFIISGCCDSLNQGFNI